MQTQVNYKQVIANNLQFLMRETGTTRKELCDATDIKYTTLCDWLKGRTYPRLDSLELVAGYFSLDLPNLFIDLEHDKSLTQLTEYARRLSMAKKEKKDYSDQYPQEFWDLFGSTAGIGFEEPEDFPMEEPEFIL